MKYIKTKRLILRDWQESDLKPFIKMNLDPDVRRYFPNLQTPEESVNYAKASQKSILDRGFGLFAVERKDTGEFIGFTGIRVLEADGSLDFEFLPCIEIGWRLAKKHWNQGFATEAARGVMKFVERQTDIKEVYAFTAKKNIPSINIMEKLGMEVVTEFEHPSIMEGHSLKPHILYKVSTKKGRRLKM